MKYSNFMESRSEEQSVNIRPQVVVNNFPENQKQFGNNKKTPVCQGYNLKSNL